MSSTLGVREGRYERVKGFGVIVFENSGTVEFRHKGHHGRWVFEIPTVI
jgi:hypothetical protein